jgi:hypothetical protein
LLLLLQESDELRAEVVNGQSDDVEIVAAHTLDEGAADALNAVAARLVHGFARVHVRADHFGRRIAEKHFGLFEKLDCVSARLQNHAGVHELRLAAEALQHLARLLLALGLAEDLALEHDDGVGADDQIGRLRSQPLGHLLHFAQRRVHDEIGRVGVVGRLQILFERRRDHLERQPYVLQHLLAPRRTTRQNYALLLQHVLKRLQHARSDRTDAPAQIRGAFNFYIDAATCYS